MALLALAALGGALFRVHLAGQGTFIGDSDRLNTFLNIRKFEVESIQSGRPLAWNEFMFMGFGMYGLHYMLPGANLLAYIEALFPIQGLFRLAGYVSCGLLILAGWSAYLFIKDTCGHPFSAFVGAALYSFSAFSIVRISQVDHAFAVLIHIPLGLLVLRRLRHENLALCFLGLTLILVSLFYFTFLQEVAYVILLFGAFAVFRSLRVARRDPLVVFVASLFVAGLVAVPRVYMVLEDFQLLDRTKTFHTTCWCEIFRWFNDGIFGRYPAEQAAIGNGINLHEGVQLYTSMFAALLIVVGIFRFRGAVESGAAVAFLAVLGLVFRPWIGPLKAIGLALVLIGLYAAWVRVKGPRSTLSPSMAREADAPFHLCVLTGALAIILIEKARYIFYLMFDKIDFTHSRITIAALLPMCALVAVFIADMYGRSEQHPDDQVPMLWLSGSALVTMGALWLIDSLTSGPLTAHLGMASPIRLGTWIWMLPSELMRTIWGTLVFGIVTAGIWAYGKEIRVRRVLIYSLGFMMVFQAFEYADFQLGGAHTWTFPVPFRQNNFLNVQAGALRPPSEQEAEAFHERLHTDQFRSVLVADPEAFPAFSAPHISQFWRLRLLEGYGAGVPRRLAVLPWPEGVRTLRALSFPSPQHLPWALLSLLNVKYAVTVNPAFYYNYNLFPNRALGRTDLRPDQVEIVENPLPVVPRQFFAASVRPSAVARGVRSAESPPGPPWGVTPTTVSSTAILLTWAGNWEPESVYRIERRPVAGEYAEIGVVGASARSYLNTGLKPGETYFFRLRACTVAECSNYSKEVSAATSVGTVPAPMQLKATVISGREILLTWEDVTPGAVYRIERRAGIGERYTEIGVTRPGARSFRIEAAMGTDAYFFRLRACLPEGCSRHSAEASAGAPAAIMAAGLRGILPADITRESVAEGFPAPARFSTQGTIHAIYSGDRIGIQVDPLDQPRFLVLNELYHPRWRAFAGKMELKIYPTNIVMRGIVVPPGVSEVELRFVPFLFTWAAVLFITGGLVLLLGAWLAFRRIGGGA